jgi:acetylornithine deacetylase
VIVAHLAERLGAHGFDVDIVAAGRRPSLLARSTGTGHGRKILLNGHLDTVGVAGMSDPFGGTLEGNRLLGRGAADMKGGVASMVAAAEAVVARRIAGDVILALVADEEHGSIGTEAVLKHLGGRLPDGCIVGEPTWLDLVVAHRGYALVEVILSGRAAHSSQPELGVNAVAHLGRLLTAVEAHPLVGTGSLQATTVSGGSSAFVLAESARALVERRTVPGERASRALDEVERILTGLRDADPSVQAVAVLGLTREAWEHDPSSPAGGRLARELAGALEQHGRTPAEVGAPYWMESALWEGAGVPTIVCGPGGGGLHAADEWVDLDQVGLYASVLVDTVSAFCA